MIKKVRYLFVLLLVTIVAAISLKQVAVYAQGLDEKTYEENIKEDAILRINKCEETLNDYNLLEINGVQLYNLNIVQKYIKLAKDNKKSNLNIDEIRNVVNEVIDRISESLARINKGQATIEDYEYIGIKDVNSNNIVDVNEWIKGRIDESGINANIHIVLDALKSINNGDGELKSFEILNIKGVNLNNISAIEKLILSKKSIINRELTRKEIKEIVDSWEGLKNDAFQKINLGTASVEDYVFVGIINVNVENLACINVNVRGGKYTDKIELQEKVDSILKIYNSIKSIDEVLKNISNGTATIEEYSYLGIIGVDNENVKYVNVNIQGRIYSNSTEVQVLVNKIVAEFEIYTKIKQGTATIEDYKNIGVLGVTEENLNFININIKGSVSFELKEVQAKIDMLIIKFNSFVKINEGNGTVKDYENIGISNVTNENLLYINLNIKGSGIFIVEDMKLKISGLIEKYDIYLRINLGIATVEDYKILEVNNVTDINIKYINSNTKGKNLLLLSEIKTKVNIYIKEFNAYIIIDNGSAALSEYKLLGVSNVNEVNIVYINEFLKGKRCFSINELQVKINTIVNIFARIESGTATLEDYKVMGITTVTTENIIYINADLKEKGYVSIEKIKNQIDSSCNIYMALSRISIGKGTLMDYKLLGITNISINNLVYVNLNIRTYGVKTINEVRITVNNIIEIHEMDLKITKIFEKINNGTADLEDYGFIGIEGVTDQNIDYINLNIKDKGYCSVEEVQLNVDNSISIYNVFIKINKGNASLEDYKIIGITNVTIENIDYINIKLKGKVYTSSINIKTDIEEIIQIYNSHINIISGNGSEEDWVRLGITITKDTEINIKESYVKIISGNAKIEDYKILGITGVTVENIRKINILLEENKYVTVKEIQLVINNYIEMQFIIEKINRGEAAVSDYELIGITNVNIINIDYINLKLRGGSYTSIEDIQVNIKNIISVYNSYINIINGNSSTEDLKAVGIVAAIENEVEIKISYQNILKGKAELEDYNILGITGVTIDNISEINVLLSKGKYITIKDIVEVVNKYSRVIIFDRINKGEATVLDYEVLGITNVNINNITYINVKLAGNEYKDITMLKVDIEKIINIYSASTRIEAGNGSDEDYEALGIIISADDKASIKEAYNRILSGNGFVKDYVLLGLTNVNEDNIAEINVELSSGKYLTIEDISIRISNIVKIKAVLNKIDKGSAVLEDYKVITTLVTESNISDVSLVLKGKHYIKITDIVLINNIITNINSYYFEYKLNDDNTAIITDYTGNGSELTIPSEIKKDDVKYKVTGIDLGVFLNNCTLEKVVIPETIHELYEDAFYGCSNLKKVELSNGVTEIGELAFGECTSLEEIVISNTVVRISESAFKGCDKLNNIRFVNASDVNAIKEYGFNIDDYNMVILNGDNYNEIQLVKKGCNKIIYDESKYKLYIDNNIVNDTCIVSDGNYELRVN